MDLVPPAPVALFGLAALLFNFLFTVAAIVVGLSVWDRWLRRR